MSENEEPTSPVFVSHSFSEGTLVFGNTRPDAHRKILDDNGFKFSRQLEMYFLPRSRNKTHDEIRVDRLVEALTALGLTVRVEIDDEPIPFAQQEANRAARRAERAERLTGLSPNEWCNG